MMNNYLYFHFTTIWNFPRRKITSMRGKSTLFKKKKRRNQSMFQMIPSKSQKKIKPMKTQLMMEKSEEKNLNQTRSIIFLLQKCRNLCQKNLNWFRALEVKRPNLCYHFTTIWNPPSRTKIKGKSRYQSMFPIKTWMTKKRKIQVTWHTVS